MLYGKYNVTNVSYCFKGLKQLIGNNDIKKIPGIFHYTGTEVLEALLSSGTFWATNLYYLNDASEYKTGIECLRKAMNTKTNHVNEDTKEFILKCINEIGELDGYTWPGVFSISFSLKEDVLNQWITYAKEGGVCIGFDKDILFEDSSLKIIEKCEKKILDVPKECLARMHYNENAEDSLLNAKKIINAIKETLKGYILAGKITHKVFEEHEDVIKLWLILLASYFKNGDFSMEEEARMVFPILSLNDTSADIFYHKNSSGILRPYIKILFKQCGEPVINYIDALPITSIMVGPAGSQKTLFSSIVHRVEYGKSCIWKYEPEKLKCLFLEYVNSCLLYCTDTLKKEITDKYKRDETAKEIVYKLFNNWNNRLLDKYELEDVEIIESNYKYQASNRAQLKSIGKGGQSKLAESNEHNEINRVLNKWCKNNYFTKQGVWIKRSSIPYVY